MGSIESRAAAEETVIRRSSKLLHACRPAFSLCLAMAVLGPGCREQSPGDAPSEAGPDSHLRTPREAGQGIDEGLPEGIAAILEMEATYPEGFSFLNGVREFADGTVLAADPLAQLLLRIDMDAATADTLGRVGPGPQEYEQPDQVFPLPGDSSLLVDLGKARLTVLSPEGILGNGISMMVPSGEGSPALLHPRFVDGGGNLYTQRSRSRDTGPPDSAAVTRFDRVTGTLDTVATIWLPGTPLRRTERFGYLPRMLEPRDDWAVGPDGRIAVVRAAGFSVEWTLPDGQRLTGPPHPFGTEGVNREDREALMTEMRSSAISTLMVASRTGGVQRMSMSRGLGHSGDGPGVDDFEWSETFPPFRPDRTLISPRGEAWVERWMPIGSDSRWEVFDGKGIWLGSVLLPPRRQIIGFGNGPEGGEVAYVTRTDEYDLKWLERHRVIR